MWIAYPAASATIGVGYIEDRPQAAAIVARIITAWADVEVQCARLLATLVGTDVPAVAAVFGSLRSSRAQSDALEAAAKTTLSEQDYELFTAHMARRTALEKERNDLAHGCFGVAASIPDHIAWVAQSDLLEYTARRKHDESASTRFKKKIFVYELGTLERIAQELQEFHAELGFLSGYLLTQSSGAQSAAFRAQRYRQLCNQSHIRRALHHIRTRKKTSQAPPPRRASKRPREG
jgi:hypothetical protein